MVWVIATLFAHTSILQLHFTLLHRIRIYAYVPTFSVEMQQMVTWCRSLLRSCTCQYSSVALLLCSCVCSGPDVPITSLTGQFWNIPLTIAPYVGPYGDGIAQLSDKIYSITASYPGAPERTFIADYGKRDWLDNRPCLYAGNRNGGPIWEVKGSSSVIEGKASDYKVDGLFDTDFQFSKYNDNC